MRPPCVNSAKPRANTRPKAVDALSECRDKTDWTRIGVAHVCRDRSITGRLDALPVFGTFQVRDDDRGGDER